MAVTCNYKQSTKPPAQITLAEKLVFYLIAMFAAMNSTFYYI
jgi:hypothetical protein